MVSFTEYCQLVKLASFIKTSLLFHIYKHLTLVFPTFPCSKHLVSMTTVVLFCSHTIRQKSFTVSSRGPSQKQGKFAIMYIFLN